MCCDGSIRIRTDSERRQREGPEDPAQIYAGKTPDATVDIDEIQIGYLVMGTLGGGTLHYQGKDYRFKLGGLGAGGAGADKLKATVKSSD